MTRATSILIIEDDFANVQLLTEMLHRAGYVVRPACDGNLALAAAKAEPPDLILLDIMMPDIDGFAICEALKADARTCPIPVIFISARDHADYKVRAFQCGGVDYITKPFQLPEVLVRVQMHLALRQLQAQLATRNDQLQRELDERKRVEDDLRYYVERLKIMHEIDQSIVAARSSETIAVAATGRVRQLMQCQRVLVIALTETGQLKPLAAESSGALALGSALEIYREVFALPTLQAGRIHGVPDLRAVAQPAAWHRKLVAAGVRSCVIIPLQAHGELLGALHLEATEAHHFNATHLAAATEVAAPLAVAIHQARLYERAQQEIAERKLIEERLREQTLELESRNADLDAFAHTVAHDLKTPLSVVLGFSALLHKRYDQVPGVQVLQTLDTITRSARKMASIINALLLLSSVRKMDEVPLEPLHMADIVAEVRERLAESLQARQGSLESPTVWPTALGYPAWVEEIWANYISNALKYGGDPPRVLLGADVLPDGQIRYWVRDNGAGLSVADQARLFTDFTRLDESQSDGHGLGLSIARRIAHKLGGAVGVESVLGEGCTFWFTLPAS